MTWLIIILHLFVGSTLAGVGIVAVLVMGYVSMVSIATAVLVGYTVAIPLSAVIARAMKNA